jgi:DNA-binding CsgD family transcriptional regulator
MVVIQVGGFMADLALQDFERLFKFTLDINKQHSDFEYAVLDSLSEHLNIHLSSYTVINHEADGSRMISKNISRAIDDEALEQYRTQIHEKDIFINHFGRKRSVAISTNIYTSNDFPEGEFESSEYGKYLASFNIAHQAILGIKNRATHPSHYLSIYKPTGSEKFTEYELALFQYIGKSFNSAVSQYIKYSKQNQIINITDEFASMVGIGYVLIDPADTIVYHNDAYLTLSTQISEEPDLASMTQELIERITKEPANVDKKIMECEVDGFVLTLCRKKISTPTGFRKYRLLSIRDKMRYESRDNSRVVLMEAYNVTSREAEIMLLMSKGIDNNEISDALFISMSTVKSHIRNIYSKLGVSSRTELLRKIRPHTRSEME